VFEIGRVFDRDGAGFSQPLVIGGLAYGSALPEQWGEKPRAVDFFDVKGDLEALAAAPGTSPLTPRRSRGCIRAAPAAVRIHGVVCGFVGELHPRLARHYGFPQAAVVFQVELAPLLAGLAARRPRRRAVPDRPPRPGRHHRRGRSGRGAVIEALHDAAPPHVQRLSHLTSTVAPVCRRAEKPCDSGAYAGYCTYFDGRRHRRDGKWRWWRCSNNASVPRSASRVSMTLTKAELADLLFEQLGLNKREAKDMVERFLRRDPHRRSRPGIASSCRASAISSCAKKPQRPGRNPKTGEEIPITARRVVTFHASQKLKAMVEASSHAGLEPR
jgi:integration host factor subunit alpha